MTMNNDPQTRMARARVALEGLSVGDAFGGFYEGGRETYQHRTRTLFSPPWHWTDNTSMALSIYAVLRTHQTIDQDALAKSFGDHFDRSRGYGLGARTLLSQIRAGMDWRVAAPAIFKGGSFGNGGAMRVAPLGAYFADDLALCAEQAALSCEITHSHPEGIAGAVAAAVATGAAASLCGKPKPSRAAFIDLVLPLYPRYDGARRLYGGARSACWHNARRSSQETGQRQLDSRTGYCAVLFVDGG